jgi:uncharacterized Ntn-hydrolase superfamily protein
MTYSIVARDQETGELGVAVQSHFFGVGSLVSWAESGVGAVATQSVAEPAYGPRGLDLMRSGKSAPEVLHRLLADDPQESVRQVAMVDRWGRVAVHTGGKCIAAAGHRVGDQVTVQANMMARPTVWDAMLRAYQSAEGDLCERLVSALEAAEGEGGDIRGRQSAALLVVTAKPTGKPLEDKRADLRVDDHDQPLAELRRLLGMKRAYDRIDVADELAAKGDFEAALAEYSAAHRSQPDNAELAFWHGVALATGGREQDARPLLERAYAEHDGWRELLRRLPASGLFPDDDELVARLTRSGQTDFAAPAEGGGPPPAPPAEPAPSAPARPPAEGGPPAGGFAG